MADFLNNLEKYRITNVPRNVYYIPNFITLTEEEKIVSQVNAVPKPKWTQLMDRRLQNWGGTPHQKGMIAEFIPQWLQVYMDRIHKLSLMNGNVPNHCLVNEYLPNQGIMPHVDGSVFYPTITTISCGSHTVIKFRKRPISDGDLNPPFTHSILLERASLFIVQEDMYENYQHCIENKYADEITEDIANLSQCSSDMVGHKLDRGIRLSLTIRHVPKTTRLKIRI